jgi:outer membrane protein
MLRKYIIIISIGILLSLNTNAQEWDWATSVHYSVGIPTGDLKDFTDNTSGRGAIFEARNFRSDQFSIGFSIGWQVFKDRLEGTFSQEGQDITGTQVRYVNTLPIMFTGHYYLGDPGSVRPYLGAGVGTVRSLQRTDVGLFTLSNNNWHFGFYPEVGVFIPVSFDMGINVAAKYNYGIGTSDSFDYTYLALSVGFTWLN